MFKDAVCITKRRLHIAATKAEIERHIGVGVAREMLEIGERPRGLERIVHDCRRAHSCHLVKHGWKLLVFRSDQRQGLFGDIRVFSQHNRDRLADVTDLAVGEDRLVMEGRPVVRVWNYFEHVLDCDHAKDSRKLARGTGVDLSDKSMRDGAAKNLSVQHARKSDVVDIVSPPRHLGACFQARRTAADAGQSSPLM